MIHPAARRRFARLVEQGVAPHTAADVAFDGKGTPAQIAALVSEGKAPSPHAHPVKLQESAPDHTRELYESFKAMGLTPAQAAHAALGRDANAVTLAKLTEADAPTEQSRKALRVHDDGRLSLELTAEGARAELADALTALGVSPELARIAANK